MNTPKLLQLAAYLESVPDKKTVRIYEHAWVAIFQDDGTFVVCRMD